MDLPLRNNQTIFPLIWKKMISNRQKSNSESNKTEQGS